jgi:hypothetical protein
MYKPASRRGESAARIDALTSSTTSRLSAMVRRSGPFLASRAPAEGHAMHLIEILLPLYANDGTPQSVAHFRTTERELVERFGGVTTYLRAPARGKWLRDGEHVERDEIVTCEVMAETLDRSWWESYRKELEERFEQHELVVRAFAIESL